MSGKAKLALFITFFCIFFATWSYAGGGLTDTGSVMKLLDEMRNEIGNLKGELGNLRSQLNDKKYLENTVKSLQHDLKVMQTQNTDVNVLPENVNSLPEWVKGTTFGGDLRLRYQSDYSKGARDRHRPGRLRLRYGFKKQLTDELLVGFKLGTGSSSDRDSGDVTLGNANPGFRKLHIWVDKAYLEYSPLAVEGLTIIGGKFTPNWAHHDVIFCDADAGVDGIGESYVFSLTDSIDADINLAQLIVRESSNNRDNSEMYVFDVGVSKSFENSMICSVGFRGTGYIFSGFKSGSETYANGIGGSNSASIGNPRVFVGSADLGLDINGIPVDMYVLGAVNVTDRSRHGDIENRNAGFGFGLTINELCKVGDMSFWYQFARFEKNVMPSNLVDTDVGVGNEGHWFSLAYRLFDCSDLSCTLITPRSIETGVYTRTATMKIELNTRF